MNMETASETHVGEGNFEEYFAPTDVQIQDASIRYQQISNTFFGFLARLLGFGALLASLLFMAWGWLRLI